MAFSVRQVGTQPLPPLVLAPPAQPLVPTEFYVAQVVDERPDRSAVAWLLPAPGKAGLPPSKAQPVDLQGGGSAALRETIFRSLARNAALRPVTIRVREFQLIETPATAAGQVTGRVRIGLAFEWQRRGRVIPLTDYQAALSYTRPAQQPTAPAPVLQQALQQGLAYLNTWMSRQAPGNEKLVTRLQVSFADDTRSTEPDTLFYAPGRPLTFADFRAEPRPAGRYAASVFPSFAYQGQARVADGVLHIHLTLKTFVVRSSSWVLPTARDAYTLNHEQRHFDLVKLVVEHYKQRLTPDSLSLDLYNGQIQFQYLRAWWEMNRVQEQYDGETNGGRDPLAQQRWNQRIDDELRRYGLK